MCGEHSTQFALPTVAVGSSPRVRGTHWLEKPNGRSRGIIPACAGNTNNPMVEPQNIWDHPRVCGEHAAFDIDIAVNLGIIPACAGNTASASTLRLTARDHPRVCGKHSYVICKAATLAGSSPRVRETPVEVAEPCGLVGIIPACAGNTSANNDEYLLMRDHPRVCGKHLL